MAAVVAAGAGVAAMAAAGGGVAVWAAICSFASLRPFSGSRFAPALN